MKQFDTVFMKQKLFNEDVKYNGSRALRHLILSQQSKDNCGEKGAVPMDNFIVSIRNALQESSIKKDDGVVVSDLLDILTTSLVSGDGGDYVCIESLEFILGEIVINLNIAHSLLDVLKAVRTYMLDLAYQEALTMNSRPLRRSRLMIVGEGASGKSSFLLALTHQQFVAEWNSTVGLSVEEYCVQDKEKSDSETLREAGIGIEECVLWKVADRDISEGDRTLRSQTVGTVTKGSKKNRRLQDRVADRQRQKENKEEVTKDKKIVVKTTMADDPLPEDDRIAGRGDVSFDNISNSEAGALSFSVWDYGGQRVFQTVQHLFLSRFGVYVLAFDMTRLSIHTTSPEVMENSMTFVQFWLRQISMTALGAPVILLGTHNDKLPEDENEREKIHFNISLDLKRRFKKFGTAWDHLLVHPSKDLVFFPTSNRADDPTIAQLRELISTCAENDRIDANKDEQSYVNLPVPVSWLRVCDTLKQLERSGTSYLYRVREADFDEFERDVMTIAEKCGVFEDIPSDQTNERRLRLSALLDHFNRLGMLFYIGTTGLDNLVILNPQWIIDMIVTAVRDFSLHPLRRDRKLITTQRDNWYDFINRGVLNEKMMKELWFEQRDNIPFLIKFFEKILLLCKLPAKEGDTEVRYLLPSVYMAVDDLLPVPYTAKDKAQDFCASITINFPDFLPDTYLSRLIVLLVSQCSEWQEFPLKDKENRPVMPCLFRHKGVTCCGIPISGSGVVLCQDDNGNIYAHICHSLNFVNGLMIEEKLQQSLKVLEENFYPKVVYILKPPEEGYGSILPTGGSLNALRASQQVMDRSKDLFFDGNPLAPKLTKNKYYCYPPVSELTRCVDAELRRISSFIIGHQDWGEIFFLNRCNLIGIDLDSIVSFEHGKVRVYPESYPNKPECGKELNIPAIVTLFQIFGQSEKELRQACKALGTKYESYFAREGKFSFAVDHFSGYDFSSYKGSSESKIDDTEDEADKQEAFKFLISWVEKGLNRIAKLRGKKEVIIVSEQLFKNEDNSDNRDIHLIVQWFATGDDGWTEDDVKQRFNDTTLKKKVVGMLKNSRDTWFKICQALSDCIEFKPQKKAIKLIDEYFNSLGEDLDDEVPLWFRNLKEEMSEKFYDFVSRWREITELTNKQNINNGNSQDLLKAVTVVTQIFNEKFQWLDIKFDAIQAVLLRGMLEVAEVKVPSTFMIVNHLLTPVGEVSENKEEMSFDNISSSKNAQKMLQFYANIKASVSEMVETVKKTKVSKNCNIEDLINSPISICYGEKAYFYLVDEITMKPIVPSKASVDNGCPYPLVIDTPHAFISKHIGLMMMSLTSVSYVNKAAGLAQIFFPGIPTIPTETLKQCQDALDCLDMKSTVERFDVIQKSLEDLNGDGVGNDETSETYKKGVRGRALRELERFYSEQDNKWKERNPKGQRVTNFCDLERVVVDKETKLDDGTILAPGTCVWTLPTTRNSRF